MATDGQEGPRSRFTEEVRRDHALLCREVSALDARLSIYIYVVS